MTEPTYQSEIHADRSRKPRGKRRWLNLGRLSVGVGLDRRAAYVGAWVHSDEALFICPVPFLSVALVYRKRPVVYRDPFVELYEPPSPGDR